MQVAWTALDAVRGFPGSWSQVVVEVVEPAPPLHASDPFHVVLDGELLAVPYRIYGDELAVPPRAELHSAGHVYVASCLNSRHHDGVVRQRALRQLLAEHSSVAVPYVVQLAGEYVVEILEDLARWTGDSGAEDVVRRDHGRFLKDNATYFETTMSRIVSYWNCYYRWTFPAQLDARSDGGPVYPGLIVARWLSGVAEDEGWAQRLPVPAAWLRRS